MQVHFSKTTPFVEVDVSSEPSTQTLSWYANDSQKGFFRDIDQRGARRQLLEGDQVDRRWIHDRVMMINDSMRRTKVECYKASLLNRL